MISVDDPFAPLLHQFMNINYTTDSGNKHCGPKPSQPLSFQDRHISSTLQLRKVVRAPWIPTALRNVCEDAIKGFTSTGNIFVYNEEYARMNIYYPLFYYTAEGVSRYYVNIILPRCLGFASKLIFSPKDTEWFSFLTFQRNFTTQGDFYHSCTVTLKESEDPNSDEWSISIPPETQSNLADWVIPTLRAMGSEKVLVNYEFYVNNDAGEEVLRKVGPRKNFKWEAPTTVGSEFPCSVSPQPHDSTVMNSLFPELASSMIAAQKPPNRTEKKHSVVPPIECPAEVRERPRDDFDSSSEDDELTYKLNIDHYIQLAWTKAVENDASFIVLQCGRYERIGIRHRETQTLYLSNLIATTREKGYGQMHLGLLIAAIKDRLEQVDISGTPKDLKQKCAPKDRPTVLNSMKDKATMRKRQRSKNPEVNKQRFDNELGERDLALIYLCFDSYYHSPAPSSFRRMEPSCTAQPFSSHPHIFQRKQAYPPESYITVIVNKPHIGHGALGHAYKVSVEIETSSGEKQRRDMVMKLATGRKKYRMIAEYEAYKKLAEAGVTYGIVGVHGLFRDMETGAMMILMDDAGITLRDRGLAHGESDALLERDVVKTSSEEMEAYVKVLRGIQSANISHGDIRIDNLMINDQGEVFIIDFDRMAECVNPADFNQLLRSIGWGHLLKKKLK